MLSLICFVAVVLFIAGICFTIKNDAYEAQCKKNLAWFRRTGKQPPNGKAPW